MKVYIEDRGANLVSHMWFTGKYGVEFASGDYVIFHEEKESPQLPYRTIPNTPGLPVKQTKDLCSSGM